MSYIDKPTTGSLRYQNTLESHTSCYLIRYKHHHIHFSQILFCSIFPTSDNAMIQQEYGEKAILLMFHGLWEKGHLFHVPTDSVYARHDGFFISFAKHSLLFPFFQPSTKPRKNAELFITNKTVDTKTTPQYTYNS